MTQANVEMILKNSMRKASNEKLKKRIMAILGSVPFMQLGYTKAIIDKYKAILRDSDVCIYFYYFEALIKAYARDPLCPSFDDILKAIEHFQLFEDDSESDAFRKLNKSILTVTPETVLHVWFTYANKIFKLADNSSSFELLIDKRLFDKISWFSLERKYFNSILASEALNEAIAKDISIIQKVFLFLRIGADLEMMHLILELHKYVEAYIRPMDIDFIKFQAFMSMTDRKTEYQAVNKEEVRVNVDINEFIDLVARISYYLCVNAEYEPSLDTLFCESPRVQLYLDTESQISAKSKEISQKFSSLIRGLDSYTNSDMQRMGMREIHTNLFIYTDNS
jgi:hypothetical protein